MEASSRQLDNKSTRKVVEGPGKGWSLGKQYVPRKQCATCGVDFYTPPAQIKRGGGKFCSYKCKGIAFRKSVYTRTCAVCREKYETSNFHSKRCIKCLVPIAPPIFNACKQCGKATARIYCGQACYTAYRMEHPFAKGLKCNATCKRCSKPFYASPYQKRHGWGLYCSIPCRTVKLRHGSGKGGTRPDLGIYVRSSWEANYARYLNWLQGLGEIERWEYEADTFEFPVKRGAKFYTPDFKVFEKGKHFYVEVKGYMDARSKTKLKRMAKHYPGERVDLVMNKEMTAIAKSVSAMIPNWERNVNDKISLRQ